MGKRRWVLFGTLLISMIMLTSPALNLEAKALSFAYFCLGMITGFAWLREDL